jgi:GTP-binding protein YchF
VNVVEHLGLVGLPNAGKTSLFNALTGAHAPVAPHPFTTTETKSGAALLPDSRVEALAEMSRSRKVVHASVEVVDIAGLVAGSSSGEGLGNRFLAGIREVDALCLVLRAFEDPEVAGEVEPVEALGVLELELVLADLASLETQLERRRKAARVAKGDRSLEAEVAAWDRAHAALSDGVPLYRAGLTADEMALLVPAFLLTAKPVIAVVNLGEDQLGKADAIVDPVVEHLSGQEGPGSAEGELGAPSALAACVQLEAEAAELGAGERAEMLEGLGLGEGALARVARSAYHVLGRRTFLTTGEKETRAWSFREGSTAPVCAGVIHSDLQRGFIRAEVVHWDKLIEAGSWSAAKSEGRIRLEGKEYVVQDGDVLEIRFNV